MIQFDDNVERQDEVAIRKIKESGLPVVLWGAGEYAGLIERKLRRHGIDDIYFVIDGMPSASNVYRIDEIEQKLEAYNLIPAFAKAAFEYKHDKFSVFKHFRELFYIRHILDAECAEHIDAMYIKEHSVDFQAVYDILCDDKSRCSFDAFIKGKVTDDTRDIYPLIESPQYFSGDFIKLADRECLVDCGAYNGDSIVDFLAATDGMYERIFAFEPDEKNAAALRTMIDEKNLHDVEVIQRGAYDRVTELSFDNDGSVFSKIDEQGATVIKTDTIDNVVGDRRVTFIKMDIEGAERNALDGAAQTIRRCRPVLALSAYHRSDDIFVLHRRMKELLGDCDFYFRLHKPSTTDAVLYAVPK